MSPRRIEHDLERWALPGHPGEPSQPERAIFRAEGDYWTIVYEGELIRLRDSRGLRYLAALLRRPGERVHVRALVAASRGEKKGVSGEPGNLGDEPARLSVTKALKTALERICACHPALSRHLAATIRRGYYCSYTPDPRRPINWTE